MSWVKFSDSVDLSQIERSYLNENLMFLVFLIFEILSLSERAVVWSAWLSCFSLADSHIEVQLLVDVGCNQIEYWNDVTGEVLKLPIKLLIKLAKMFTIDFKNRFFEFTKFG